MQKENIVFADSELAQETLVRAYPEATQIGLVEHGYDNIVGLVDASIAARFPRNDDAYMRSQFEKVVLSKLIDLEYTGIPRIINEVDNPPCLITSFVSGAHLSPAEVNSLAPEDQEAFGRDIAQFAFDMHGLLSVDEIRELREKLGFDELEEDTWSVYFDKTLGAAKLQTCEQNKLAYQFYEQWLECDTDERLVVVHDDLHNENIFFENGRLSGVLDFGDTTIGIAEQDLRHLYRINERVLRAGIVRYGQLSGSELSLDVAITWAIAQELGAYASRLMTGDTEHPAFARAVHNLNVWLPEGEWGEGFEITKTSLR